MGRGWCGTVCRLRSLKRGRQGADSKEWEREGEREELCPGGGPCQPSAVPGWNLPGVNRMWKISRHRPNHSRNARFKCSPHLLCLSLALCVAGGSGICGGRREGEKREALKMRRGITGLYLEGLQVRKVVFCSLSKFVTIWVWLKHSVIRLSCSFSETVDSLLFLCYDYTLSYLCPNISHALFTRSLSLYPSVRIDHFW